MLMTNSRIGQGKAARRQKGLIVGIANDQSIAWGCARAFRAFGRGARRHLSQRQGKEACRAAGAGARSADLHAARCRAFPARSRPSSSGSQTTGESSISSSTPSPSRRRTRCSGRVVDVPRDGFPDDHGCLLLVLHPHGASGRAADEERRHALHHDLLRQPDGGGELQHHGRGQGGARKRGALHGRRARPEGHPRPRHFARARWRRAPPPASPSSTSCWTRRRPKRRRASLVSIDDVGIATAFLAHDAARLITGETLYIDGGYHIID